MGKSVAISVKDLTKVYHLYDKPQDRLKEALHPFRKSYHHDFYAMSGVNFDIYRGETVGIIGKNGAGKSTLLKMITGVLTPTSGSIETHGRISSLLELGAGFNPEMTGLENIYLNGTLMGFSDSEMDDKIENILTFADIGEFIHQPVKMYSSGMFARLAFSVSINVEPDILIVDEALSVGDMAFQMKCFKKFQEFQEQNRTILFVTHSLDTVIRYCSRGIVIDGGEMICDESAKEAVDLFKQLLTGHYDPSRAIATHKKENTQKRVDKIVLKDQFTHNKESLKYGNNKAIIYDYGILDRDGRVSIVLDYDQRYDIVMKIEFYEYIESPVFAFTIKDAKGMEITGTNTVMKHVDTLSYKKGDKISVSFTQNINIRPGHYSLSLGCVGINDSGIEVYSRLYDIILFEVIGTQEMVGFYDLKSDITIDTQ
ncbi:Teichoic acid export ATP-binding protein TagH [hydrothermal vent metagenome]|uniref:Teichoic acid export ATP-binding protein TagH n=1 Tax=hydrothermal vent metagenome TaxID=652676 RepID=A0A1W1BHF4_9ZZZZ